MFACLGFHSFSFQQKSKKDQKLVGCLLHQKHSDQKQIDKKNQIDGFEINKG